MLFYSQENGSNERKKCRCLRTEVLNAMRTTEFKVFCREEHGSAPNDFQIHQCERTASVVSEAAIIGCSIYLQGITHEAISLI